MQANTGNVGTLSAVTSVIGGTITANTSLNGGNLNVASYGLIQGHLNVSTITANSVINTSHMNTNTINVGGIANINSVNPAVLNATETI
jgi:hypothetical protein